jgi:hypothetical protein
MDKDDSPARMQLNDRVQVVMVQEKAAALSVGVLKKYLVKNKNHSNKMQRKRRDPRDALYSKKHQRPHVALYRRDNRP